MNTVLTHNAQETQELGRKLAQQLRSGDVVVLDGDMGMGKSELARGIAKGLGVVETVTSPSFTILQMYTSGSIPLYHFDWYRIASVEEIYELSMEEYLGGDGIALVEWASQAREIIPPTHLHIALQRVEENTRRITLTPMGGFRHITC